MSILLKKWVLDVAQDLENKVSNAVVVVTDDMKRREEIKKLIEVSDKFESMDFSRIAFLDILKYKDILKVRGKLPIEVYDENGKTIDAVDLQQIQNSISLTIVLEQLVKKYTLVVWYIHDDNTAQMFADPILSIHTNTELYADRDKEGRRIKRHGLIVFSDLNYWWKMLGLPTYILMPTDEEYNEIFQEIKDAYKRKYENYNVNIEFPTIYAVKGFTLFDTYSVLNRAKKVTKKGDAISITFDLSKIAELKKNYFRSIGIDIINSDINFSYVGGMEKQKKIIENYIIPAFRERDRAVDYGISIPKGILFYGYPGNGKSWMIKATAGELGIPVLAIDSSKILSPLVGKSEENLDRIFRLAELIGAAIWFDEIDQIARNRDELSGLNMVDIRLVNILLTAMQEREVFVMATTNYINKIDPAVKRRFNFLIEVEFPKKEDRRQAFIIHVEKYRPVKPELRDNIDYDRLAEESEGFTFAEIEEAVRRAKIDAFRQKSKLTTNHILTEIYAIKENINFEERKRYMKDRDDSSYEEYNTRI